MLLENFENESVDISPLSKRVFNFGKTVDKYAKILFFGTKDGLCPCSESKPSLCQFLSKSAQLFRRENVTDKQR